MKKLIDSMDGKERKIIGFLCLLLVVQMFFLLVVSIPLKGSYFRALSSLKSKQENYHQALKTNLEKKEEWLIWKQTLRDMEELKKKYFYDDEKGLQELRLDLQRIFQDTGIRITRLRYDYAEIKTGKVKRVNVSFNLRGPYVFLKEFIHAVEVLPKFLVIEKIDFLDINTIRGELELKVILAGYYET